MRIRKLTELAKRVPTPFTLVVKPNIGLPMFCRFGTSPQFFEGVGQVVGGASKMWIGSQSLSERLTSFFLLVHSTQQCAQIVPGVCTRRIGLDRLQVPLDRLRS